MLLKRSELPGDHGILNFCKVQTYQEMSRLNVEKTHLNEELTGLNGELIGI